MIRICEWGTVAFTYSPPSFEDIGLDPVWDINGGQALRSHDEGSIKNFFAFFCWQTELMDEETISKMYLMIKDSLKCMHKMIGVKIICRRNERKRMCGWVICQRSLENFISTKNYGIVRRFFTCRSITFKQVFTY